MEAVAGKRYALSGRQPAWRLRLYIGGRTRRSAMALDNLRELCKQRLPGQCHIKVIDVLVHPQAALTDNIVALPTLVRRFPKPERRVIGNLSNTAKVLAGLDVPTEPGAQGTRQGAAHTGLGRVS